MRTTLKHFLTEIRVSIEKNKDDIAAALRGVCQTWRLEDDGFTVHAESAVTFKDYKFDNLPVQFDYCDDSFSMKNCDIKTLEGCPETVETTFEIIDIPNLENLDYAPKNMDAVHIMRCNKLTNLKGIGTFTRWAAIGCNDNLTSLEGIQEEVYSSLDLTANKLTNFEHFPKWIDGSLKLRHNPITSLRGISDHIIQINGDLYIDTSNITSGGIGLILIEGLTTVFDDNDTTSPAAKAFNIIHEYMGKPDKIFECQAELIAAGYEAFAEL